MNCPHCLKTFHSENLSKSEHIFCGNCGREIQRPKITVDQTTKKLRAWQSATVYIIGAITFIYLVFNMPHLENSSYGNRIANLVDPIFGTALNVFILWGLFRLGNIIYLKIKKYE